jgi:hypothetical protein
MQRIIIAAVVLLLIQIGLAVTVNMSNRNFDAFVPNDRLLKFETATVDSITIFGKTEEQLVLKKDHASWVLPGLFSAPADMQQVQALLDKLADLKQGLAVATSKEAAGRFKVADDLFERRIVLRQGDTVVADLYTGASPGFHQLHVRVAGHDEVMTVELSDYEFESDGESWVDKNIVQVQEKDIKSVVSTEYSLERSGEGWQLEGLQEDQELNSQQVENLLKQISGMTIQTVMDPQEVSSQFEKAPALQYTLSYTNGNQEDFVFSKPGDEYYLLKTSNRDFFFKVDNWMVEAIQKVKRADLVQAKKTESATESNSTGK